MFKYFKITKLAIRYCLLIGIWPLIFGYSVVSAQDMQPQEELSPQMGNVTDAGQVNDFSLAGYGEKGKKTWDIAGKSADIMTDTVKLNEVTGNLYGKDENVKLKADKGDFNKTDGKLHLEKNVVITTSSGTKLTTNSLDWDRKASNLSTPDLVSIERDNVVTVATGAKGEPGLKRVSLEKDVKLDINPTEAEKAKPDGLKDKITITCDGPLEVDYEKNVAYFQNNVKVVRQELAIYSDRLDVYFFSSKKEEAQVQEASAAPSAFMGGKIDKILARGNVKVMRGENASYSEEAIYTAADKKLILRGKPKLILYSAEDLKDASAGN
ncbi:MAG: LPS export ABC transporter periplasmic protein LptC [Candidatus Omnitrophica bacterium]|nr:LPS export ABC transporter periplasmic protein LptC [Candidatus Omnitrophota bacterium]MBU1869996.1 LPS export ABC transporter periplasmic protein LptC [Candidatus Omnitrophota bacterium]